MSNRVKYVVIFIKENFFSLMVIWGGILAFLVALSLNKGYHELDGSAIKWLFPSLVFSICIASLYPSILYWKDFKDDVIKRIAKAHIPFFLCLLYPLHLKIPPIGWFNHYLISFILFSMGVYWFFSGGYELRDKLLRVGSLGVREGTLAICFLKLGIAYDPAVGVALLNRFVIWLKALLGGAYICSIRLPKRYRKINYINNDFIQNPCIYGEGLFCFSNAVISGYTSGNKLEQQKVFDQKFKFLSKNKPI